MKLIPVLLYHGVPSSGTASDDPFAVELDRFRRHLDAMAASGRTALTISDLAEALHGRRPIPDCAFALTFDDGYADNTTAIAEALRRGISATLYVTSDYLDRPNMLTRAELSALDATPGVEIGAHGVTHRPLDVLHQHTLVEEVTAAKRELGEVLGEEVRSFAYPHGFHSRDVRRTVIEAGYRSAAAVKNAVSHGADDPFAIARWTVRSATPGERVAEVLDGVAVPVSWSRERVRTRMYRGLRRLQSPAAKRVARS